MDSRARLPWFESQLFYSNNYLILTKLFNILCFGPFLCKTEVIVIYSQWRAMSTFPSSFYGLGLLTDLLSIDKSALLTWLTHSSLSRHVMPRRSHKASPSLLHKSISHNTIVLERRLRPTNIYCPSPHLAVAIFTFF